MIAWSWFLALTAAIGVVVAGLRKRIKQSEHWSEAMPRRRVDRGIHVPIFAGDRFGDDWGRF